MLSSEEKKEMLEDVRNEQRRDDFYFALMSQNNNISLDEYLHFLDDIQKIFAPFKIARDITVATLNKL